MTLASEILGRVLTLPQPQTRDVVVEHDLAARMDDGAVLLADRYAPRGAPPGPTVLVRSPYGRRGWVGVVFGRLIAERGLQAVVQSVRGTFGSGGDFNPFDERADGLATLRWIAQQPWHAGRVGMTGPSYLGLTQWAVAREGAEHLGALAPSVTASQFHGQAYGGGSISLQTALAWVSVVAVQESRLAPVRMLRALRRAGALAGQLPIGDLDRAATGRELAFFRDWLSHTAADDPYWVQRDFSAGVGEVQTPVQLVAGWHDIFLPWQLADHVALREAGRATQLIVGPWTHTAPGGAAASAREGLAWLRAHLLGDRRMLREAPVRIWVGGAKEWRDLERWPPAGAQETRLHLHPGGRLDAAPPPVDGGADRFTYDPHDPTPSLGGPTLFERTPVRDNAPLEARDDVLVYTGAPLEQPLEVIGTVRVELHLRSELAHLDVFARLCDVSPDGISRNVCDALLRTEGEGDLRVAFDLWPTAHRFGAGHRLRLLVAGGAHPRYARNPGTGEPLATATRLIAGAREVVHDAAHPSSVLLSVVACA